MPDDVSRWMIELSDNAAATRAAAAEQLCHLGELAAPAAVPLLRAVGDDDEQVREWAVAALEELGSPAVGDVAAIADLLGAANADVAYWSSTLLGRLSEEAAPAVDALTATVNDHPDLAVRQRAAWALGKIGADGRPVRSALQAAAQDPDPRLARLAQDALRRLDR